ncbi:HNH endonuclease [Mycobacterium phage Salacia]|nr:HNH endonuclease [Mycobacterium phage Salacia]
MSINVSGSPSVELTSSPTSGALSAAPPKELNLDHIDPTKKVSHNIWSWSQVRRDAEIAKCQVLCLPCHKDKTAADRKYKRLHGHVGTYDRWGCRCGLCKAAKRVKNAKQYAVRKR